MFEIIDSIEKYKKHQKIDLKPKKPILACMDNSGRIFELEDGSYAGVCATDNHINVVWNPDVILRFDPYYMDAKDATEECFKGCMEKFEMAKRGEIEFYVANISPEPRSRIIREIQREKKKDDRKKK